MDDWMMELRRRNSAWAGDLCIHRRVISAVVPRCGYASRST